MSQLVQPTGQACLLEALIKEILNRVYQEDKACSIATEQRLKIDVI